MSGLIAKTTQFELFFLFLLPDRTCLSSLRVNFPDMSLAVYANSYLGSLNNRNAIRAQLSQHTHVTSGASYALGDLRSPPVTPNTVVHIERTMESRKDGLSIRLDDDEEEPRSHTKDV